MVPLNSETDSPLESGKDVSDAIDHSRFVFSNSLPANRPKQYYENEKGFTTLIPSVHCAGNLRIMQLSGTIN